jgi:MFS family permease
MQAVAVGWQIYALTGSAFDLGLVGLVQFVPVVALGLVVGQVADRYDRRLIVGTSQVVKALAAAAFALGTFRGWLSRDAMLAILFASATARAFETPTMHTLVPGVVPPELLPRAIAAAATASQTAIICGPALGGLLYVFGAGVVYLTCTAVFVLASVLVSLIRLRSGPPQKLPITAESIFAGIAYVWRTRVVLGAISLDLFAMLLGGVTALLPIYAKDVLASGPWGLGLLRSAPAVGALAISVMLARRQIEQHVGHILFAAIGVFGLAAIALCVFDLARGLDSGARDLRCGGRRERGDPPFPGADPHPQRHAGPRHGGELDVHRQLRHARRIPRRDGGGAVRGVHLGAGRRCRRDPGRAVVEAAVPGDRAHRRDPGHGDLGARLFEGDQIGAA